MLASTWCAPVVHMMFRKGIEKGAQGFAVTHTAVVVLLVSLAFSFYAMHLPERWCPYTFDLWVSDPMLLSHCSYGKLTMVFRGLQGASHQIFHILINASHVVFLLGLQKEMLSHCLHAEVPIASHLPNETSLSLWVHFS